MMNKKNKYLDKENYVYNFNDDWNRTHNKTKIINQYKDYLGKRVAELGSNSGYHCFIIGEINGTEEIVGFDINKEALKFGNTTNRKKFPLKVSSKVKFKYSNLKNVDSDSEYFDSIISFHTLEHIFPEDLNDIILEKHRILKTGGHIIISLPYENAFPCPKHVSFFNEDKLTKLFIENGFDVIECYKDNRMSNNPNQLCVTGIFKKI